MPSILESLPSINIKQRIAVIMILTGISRLRMSRLVENPAINAQIPTTTRPLKMLEPTTLLIAMSLLPDRAALILTDASGALVPIATMVSPMITLGTLRILAREELPSTKKSAPFINSTKPMSSNKYSIINSFLAIKEWNNIKRDLYRIKNELIKVSLIVIITGCSA